MLHAVLLALTFGADAKPPVIDVWPGKPPGVLAATGDEKDITKPGEGLVAGRRLIRLGNVSKPTLTVYKPAREKDTGACVIVCPGGAYNILALDLEGTEVCEWLNSLGITGVLLKYRVPRPKEGAFYLPALMDAQRAVSTVRSRAKEWNLDPKKIGILGFSAGGHLAAATSTNHDKRSYDAIDKIDEVSCRPDFALLIYPGYLVDKARTKLSDEIRVTKETPPTFFAHAHDDPVPSESSALMYLALKKAGVPADLHVWESGGHGYGLRKTDKPVTRWPERAEEWLRQRGVIPKAPRLPKLDSGAAWKQLPLKGADVGKALPEWALTLAGPMPATTAAMLELDLKHRRDNPLGAKLAAKVRLAAATANKCDWTRRMALEDLRRLGGKEDAADDDERRVLRFARMLTLAAYSITDEEMAALRKQLGEAKLVALVQLLAHANFQDRIVLTLGVSGPVLPPLDVAVDRSLKAADAPPRQMPEPPPYFAGVEKPDWSAIDFADLKKSMETQKARPERVRVPTWDEVKKRLPPEAQKRELRIRWSLVCSGYQPELAAGWSACTRAYGEEAKPNRVFDESLFWVVTRSITCFY